MTKIQLGSGPSSSATHHLTQSSRTLNRRYVERPSNLVIEEAARGYSDSNYDDTPAHPSRLVNLRVHAADLAKAQLTSAPESNTSESSSYVPKIVELGNASELKANLPAEDTSYCAPVPTNLQQMVPAEEAIEDSSINYASTSANNPISSEVVTSDAYYNNYDNNNYLPATVNSAMSTYSDPNANYPAVSNQYPDSYNQYDAQYDNSPAVATPVNTQDLAMNIAADYAAASLGASVNTLQPGETITGLGVAPIENNSIDAIAQAASNAIASIRVATDPEEVAEQVASLKSFAENIKATSGAPEMLELSDTIEKFVSVAMKSSKIQEEVEKKTTRKSTSSSTTKKSSPAIKITSKKPATRTTTSVHATRTAAPKAPVKSTPTHRVAARKPAAARKLAPKRSARPTAPQLIADEDQDLRNALRSVAAIDEEPTPKTKKKSTRKRSGSGKRFVLAFFCAAACVAAVVYFVGSNIPDISVKVAAMQSGIEASYPSYIPRGFSPSDISSENGKITLTFKGPEKASFTLTEEKSSWDSTTLLRNYVEPNWQTSYITTHEQGITIYISGANAAWVNGGVLYKIEAASNSLTKKQLRNIVTSL